jgi:uncharacterized protein YoxC
LTTVVYLGEVMPESVESRVAVALDNVERLKEEVDRLRNRVHKVESTASAVQVLRKAVDELHESMPVLARRVAKETVSEDRAMQHRERFSNLRTYAALISVGIALGALIVALVLR